MKKVFVLALALTVVSLVACKGGKKTDATENKVDSPKVETTAPADTTLKADTTKKATEATTEKKEEKKVEKKSSK